MSSLGERLKELRGPVSQAQMARELGMKQPQYARYESGASSPSAEVIIKMCDVFCCSADDILGTHRGTSAAPKVEQRGNGNISQIGNGNTARDCSNCASKQLADLMHELRITVADLASVAAKKSAAKPPRKK